MNRQILIIVFGLILFAPLCQAMPTQELVEVCTKNTLVFNNKGEQVGKKISPMCSGYLTGVLDTLIMLDTKVCTKGNTAVTPDYLLSVFSSYIKDKGKKNNAQQTLIHAYKRAFICH